MHTTLANAMREVVDVIGGATVALRHAASAARDPELRLVFARRAEAMAGADRELHTLLPLLVSAPHELVFDHEMNDLSMLEACEQLEISTLDACGRALLAAPPLPLHDFLERQRAAAAAFRAEVRDIVSATLRRQLEDMRRNDAHVQGLRQQVRTRGRNP